MTDQFDIAFGRLMRHEGGFSDHSADPGRATKYGISQRSYPDVDIAGLTIDMSREIYRRDFWAPVQRLMLPPALTYQMFDASVNSGLINAVRMLQRATGVTDDGKFGPKTDAAVQAVQESILLPIFLSERLKFMTRLPTWGDFGKGWAVRIADNLRYAAQDAEV